MEGRHRAALLFSTLGACHRNDCLHFSRSGCKKFCEHIGMITCNYSE